MKFNLILKIAVICIAMISPIIFVLGHGYERSISAYWNTEFRPLFIITNALTSYFLFTMIRWRISGIAMMLLTAFAVDQYLTMHNIFAGVFFIWTFFILLFDKRFAFYSLIYFCCGIISIFWILLGEILVVETIVAYHLHSLIYAIKIQKRRKGHR
jgi:hypothetical protein